MYVWPRRHTDLHYAFRHMATDTLGWISSRKLAPRMGGLWAFHAHLKSPIRKIADVSACLVTSLRHVSASHRQGRPGGQNITRKSQGSAEIGTS
jgi:hypothetical protein